MLGFFLRQAAGWASDGRWPRQAWQTHRNDTSLTVHVRNIVARFWDRASGDNQWICSPAQMALGKELMSGQSDP